jgi:hypothetical protein
MILWAQATIASLIVQKFDVQLGLSAAKRISGMNRAPGQTPRMA